MNRAHRSSLFILRGPSTQPVAWRPAQSRAPNSRKRCRVRLLISPLPLARADRGTSDRGATDRAHRESAKYELTAARVSAACTPACRRRNSDRNHTLYCCSCSVLMSPSCFPISLSLSPSFSLSFPHFVSVRLLLFPCNDQRNNSTVRFIRYLHFHAIVNER